MIYIGSSADGILATQLPSGAIYDSYKLRIYVEISDNDGGKAYFQIGTALTVNSNKSNAQLQIDQILSGNIKSGANLVLYEGDSESSIKKMLALSAYLNDMSFQDKKGVSFSNDYAIPNRYGPLQTLDPVVNVSKV